MKKVSSALIGFFVALKVFAGGVVGSGAGSVEMNIQYAYSNLARWIEVCQKEVVGDGKPICSTTGRRGETLKKIVEILEKNRFKLDRLQFLSAQEYPQYFKLGPNEPDRIASTELHSEAVIYFNVDQLYVSGRPALTLPEIVSILVHEIGHQTGEPNHDFLNELGSQLRVYIDKRTLEYNFDFGTNLVNMSIINQTYPGRYSRFLFNWSNEYTRDFTREVQRYVICDSSGKQTLSGFQALDGLFMEIPGTEVAVDFIFNLRIYCYDPVGNREVWERKRLRLTFAQDKSIGLMAISIE